MVLILRRNALVMKIWQNINSMKGKIQPAPLYHPDLATETNRPDESFAQSTHTANFPDATRRTREEKQQERAQAIGRVERIETPTDAPMTITELKVCLRTGADKSPGANKITHTMIRAAGPHRHKALWKLFNASVVADRLPTAWKKDDVVHILKTKNPGSYRPISILSYVSKTVAPVDYGLTAPYYKCLHQRNLYT